jgi:4-alpha-glucanotransferase
MTSTRSAGILIPLSSMPSTESWGIGEFSDIPRMADWLNDAGLSILQLLPLNETSRDEFSPYSPLTAMAFDPQFISMRDVVDFTAIGGVGALDSAICRRLTDARAATRVDFCGVRDIKEQALRRAFDRFLDDEWRASSPRAQALEHYIAQQSWWIEDYALFRAIRAAEQDREYRSWPDPLRCADPDALATARITLEREIRFYQYVQWIAEEQWQAARRASAPLAILGDFPFLVTGDSADVWKRQDEFLLDATVGAPPDAFSETGQDWGLPPCNWKVMASRGDEWIRQRARRMAALFDGYRVDHLVGFYRTYVRPVVGKPYFLPGTELAQLEQGERLMRIFLESGAHVVVEDLGNVPTFVRKSIARLGLPGYRVLRWARDWDLPGAPFQDPANYPSASVAMTGTHDTDTLAEWWESTTPEERADLASLPSILGLAGGRPDFTRVELTDSNRDTLIEALYASGSDLLILPVQDVFGWRERINEPGTVTDSNWTFKLPWPLDGLRSQSEALACAGRLRKWADQHGRLNSINGVSTHSSG